MFISFRNIFVYVTREETSNFYLTLIGFYMFHRLQTNNLLFIFKVDSIIERWNIICFVLTGVKKGNI